MAVLSGLRAIWMRGAAGALLGLGAAAFAAFTTPSAHAQAQRADFFLEAPASGVAYSVGGSLGLVEFGAHVRGTQPIGGEDFIIVARNYFISFENEQFLYGPRFGVRTETDPTIRVLTHAPGGWGSFNFKIIVAAVGRDVAAGDTAALYLRDGSMGVDGLRDAGGGSQRVVTDRRLNVAEIALGFRTAPEERFTFIESRVQTRFVDGEPYLVFFLCSADFVCDEDVLGSVDAAGVLSSLVPRPLSADEAGEIESGAAETDPQQGETAEARGDQSAATTDAEASATGGGQGQGPPTERTLGHLTDWSGRQLYQARGVLLERCDDARAALEGALEGVVTARAPLDAGPLCLALAVGEAVVCNEGFSIDAEQAAIFRIPAAGLTEADGFTPCPAPSVPAAFAGVAEDLASFQTLTGAEQAFTLTPEDGGAPLEGVFFLENGETRWRPAGQAPAATRFTGQGRGYRYRAIFADGALTVETIDTRMRLSDIQFRFEDEAGAPVAGCEATLTAPAQARLDGGDRVTAPLFERSPNAVAAEFYSASDDALIDLNRLDDAPLSVAFSGAGGCVLRDDGGEIRADAIMRAAAAGSPRVPLVVRRAQPGVTILWTTGGYGRLGDALVETVAAEIVRAIGEALPPADPAARFAYDDIRLGRLQGGSAATLGAAGAILTDDAAAALAVEMVDASLIGEPRPFQSSAQVRSRATRGALEAAGRDGGVGFLIGSVFREPGELCASLASVDAPRGIAEALGFARLVYVGFAAEEDLSQAEADGDVTPTDILFLYSCAPPTAALVEGTRLLLVDVQRLRSSRRLGALREGLSGEVRAFLAPADQ